MKNIRNTVIVIGTIALMGVGLYALLNDEHAKEELKRMKSSIMSTFGQFNDLVSAIGGFADESFVTEELPNRLATIAQWKALGF